MILLGTCTTLNDQFGPSANLIGLFIFHFKYMNIIKLRATNKWSHHNKIIEFMVVEVFFYLINFCREDRFFTFACNRMQNKSSATK